LHCDVVVVVVVVDVDGFGDSSTAFEVGISMAIVILGVITMMTAKVMRCVSDVMC
jgi:uncharacterized membrane protein